MGYNAGLPTLIETDQPEVFGRTALTDPDRIPVALLRIFTIAYQVNIAPVIVGCGEVEHYIKFPAPVCGKYRNSQPGNPAVFGIPVQLQQRPVTIDNGREVGRDSTPRGINPGGK